MPYSLAEHAVRVARVVHERAEAPGIAPEMMEPLRQRKTLAALLMFGAHAYLPEMAPAVRAALVGYDVLRESLAEAVNLWAGLPMGAHRSSYVRHWERAVHAAALADLTMPDVREGSPQYPEPFARTYPEPIVPWDWRTAEQEYLALYWQVADLPAMRFTHVHPCPACYRKLPCNAGCTLHDSTDADVPVGHVEDCADCKARRPSDTAGS